MAGSARAPAHQILDRPRLLDDLKAVVDPQSPHTVLVLFGFEGLKEHLEAESAPAGDALLERLGKRLGELLADLGSLYEPRRGEFCALVDGGLATIRPLIATVPVELDQELRPLPIRSSLGIAVLPDEATDAIGALLLADRRLRALSGNLRPERE